MNRISWRARAREGALSLLAIGLLVAILAAADHRVRETASAVIAGGTSSGLGRGGGQLTAQASALLSAARDRTVEHTPLAAFTATAAILLVFMLRS
jgi:hypothetical protein